ncbi:hypothetical protein QVD17_03264 [Tagetes erecta]|uniref:Protein kinase domain-containing protein n=1 Tax=Tagetes erecta TaxID=13708 RepID=A0AAD8LAN4_TARER|nr:hypothetical protein QVD17_03264 [Tagetes erecta]
MFSLSTSIREVTRLYSKPEFDDIRIPLRDISLATKRFAEENLLKQGGEADVYKGVLLLKSKLGIDVVIRSGRRIVISDIVGRLKEAFEIQWKHENFNWEAKIADFGLSKVQHGDQGMSTIKTIHIAGTEFYLDPEYAKTGCCKEMDEKIIVYEHAPKGSLDMYLKDICLSWTKRLKISIDIAKGLKFLHEGDLGQDVVIHRDIKSSNILLIDDWKVKICGFEHALSYPTKQEIEYCIDNFEGSHGYSDPSFQKTSSLTKESDIYSFGVILLEILCGRMACPEDVRDDGPLLDVLVRSHCDGLEELVFEGIKKHVVLKSFSTFRKIAFQCLHEKREERPTASDVVVQLQQALEFQEAYELRKAKLDRTYEEMLREFSRYPEIYSTMWKKDIYNILSKGILLEDDKLLVKQTIWDLEQSAPFIGKHDEDYQSEPETSPTFKTYPKRRQRRHISCSALNKEMVASSSTITDQTPYPKTS